MKKFGILTAILLVACSSSSKKDSTLPESSLDDDAPATASTEGSDSSASVETSTTEHSGIQLPETDTSTERASGDGTSPAGWAEVTEDDTAADPSSGRTAGDPSARAQLGTPATAAAPTVQANLVAIKDGTAVGTVTFEQKGDTVNVTGTFTGLKPGPHSISIHEGGNCTKKGTLIGKPFAPSRPSTSTSTATATSAGTARAGELGTVTADADGNATFALSSAPVVLEEGRSDSIVRRAIVIGAGTGTGTGKAGTKAKATAPIACGVLEPSGDESRSATAAPQTQQK